LKEQETAEGHAVRAVYLYSAMADLAYEYQDKELLKQCEILWNNIVEKRMYITGSIGSASYGERFTTDYDLPNNSNYSESCATVGLAMFSNRMFQITRDGIIQHPFGGDRLRRETFLLCQSFGGGS